MYGFLLMMMKGMSMMVMMMIAGESSSSAVREAVVRRYQGKIEAEVHQICREVMAIIEHLQTSPHHDAETEVFLYKMYADPPPS